MRRCSASVLCAHLEAGGCTVQTWVMWCPESGWGCLVLLVVRLRRGALGVPDRPQGSCSRVLLAADASASWMALRRRRVRPLALLALVSACPTRRHGEPICNASYNKPCSMDVARFVAEARRRPRKHTVRFGTFADITAGAYNGERVDASTRWSTTRPVAASARKDDAVGLRSKMPPPGGERPEAVQEGLLSRLIAAAASAPTTGSASYRRRSSACAKNEESIYCPIERAATVVGASNGTYYVLSAYTDTMAPTEVTAGPEQRHVQRRKLKVLAGDAMSQLVLAPTQADFEATMRALSYSDEFHINGVHFYVFM